MPGSTSCTVSARFLVLSDTHNFEFENNETASAPFSLPLPKVDVVLHCGDLTHCGGTSSYKKALKMLGAIDAELKLVIAGNHDLELDKDYWNNHLDEDDEPDDHSRAVEVMKGRLAEEAGVTYLNEGIYTFVLENGAKFVIYASPYSEAFCDWAFAYEHNQDRFNDVHQTVDGAKSIAKHPIPTFPGVDIIMTHGPPKGILDECLQGNAGCKNLLQALRRARPKMHCFGHIHEGYGVEVVDWILKEDQTDKLGEYASCQEQKKPENEYPRAVHFPLKHGQQTLMVNAAIMDGKNKPANVPWLVDLDLPFLEKL